MSNTNVKSEWVDGNLVFYDKSGNEILTLNGSEGLVGKTGQVAGATITVGAEGATVANQRTITIQLTDHAGDDITSRQMVKILMFDDANGDVLLSGNPSSGIVIGTDGTLTPEAIISGQTTKWNAATAVSEADGDIDVTWTDSGTVPAFLAVVLPNGKMVISAALANA